MQLLLAKLCMEGGEVKEAVALYQSWWTSSRLTSPRTLTPRHRLFLGAVKAYCAAGDLDKAGEVGSVLIELGPDTPEVNAALVVRQAGTRNGKRPMPSD